MSGSAPAIADLGPRFFAFVESLERPVIFFDLETTGTDWQRDRIIEISILRVCPMPVAIEAPRTWRVNPGVRVPKESTAIHGITDEDLADEKSFAALADEFISIFKDCDLGGFAISRLDVKLLNREFERAKKDFNLNAARQVDSQVIFHRREPRDLGAAMRFYRDAELEGAHGAEADTVASLEVFAGQLARYEDLPIEVAALDRVTQSQHDAYVDRERRFMWRDGEPAFNFGKLRGKSLRAAAGDPSERAYLRWILQGSFEEDAKQLVREALEGKIRTKG
jgi:DNA polymerase-3 subunit epsilon